MKRKTLDALGFTGLIVPNLPTGGNPLAILSSIYRCQEALHAEFGNVDVNYFAPVPGTEIEPFLYWTGHLLHVATPPEEWPLGCRFSVPTLLPSLRERLIPQRAPAFIVPDKYDFLLEYATVFPDWYIACVRERLLPIPQLSALLNKKLWVILLPIDPLPWSLLANPPLQSGDGVADRR